MVVLYIFEFMAYCCFGVALFSSTCLYMGTKAGEVWPPSEIIDLLTTLKVLVIIGTTLHIAVEFLVLL